MRSEIIFRAAEKVANKYKLCQIASKATRQLHVASRDTQETINNAFVRIAAGSNMALVRTVA
jgi:DNA-directed RNA polymerase subunit K/omega